MKKLIIFLLCCFIATSMNAQLFDKVKQFYNEKTSSESSMSALAKERFTERYEMTTERQAALYGISWYRKPIVSVSNKGKRTGREIITLCNNIYESYPHVNLYKIRNYAADHLSATVGTIYYCTGTFTVSNKDYKYVKDEAFVLVIPAIKGVLIYEFSDGAYHSAIVCIDGQWN